MELILPRNIRINILDLFCKVDNFIPAHYFPSILKWCNLPKKIYFKLFTRLTSGADVVNRFNVVSHRQGLILSQTNDVLRYDISQTVIA